MYVCLTYIFKFGQVSDVLYRVVLGKAVFSAVFRGFKKIYQLYQNKNGTSGKEKEFYIK